MTRIYFAFIPEIWSALRRHKLYPSLWNRLSAKSCYGFIRGRKTCIWCTWPRDRTDALLGLAAGRDFLVHPWDWYSSHKNNALVCSLHFVHFMGALIWGSLHGFRYDWNVIIQAMAKRSGGIPAGIHRHVGERWVIRYRMIWGAPGETKLYTPLTSPRFDAIE